MIEAVDTTMSPELQERDDPIQQHLEAALEAAADDVARYHLREALQLRIAEQSTDTANHR